MLHVESNYTIVVTISLPSGGKIAWRAKRMPSKELLLLNWNSPPVLNQWEWKPIVNFAHAFSCAVKKLQNMLHFLMVTLVSIGQKNPSPCAMYHSKPIRQRREAFGPVIGALVPWDPEVPGLRHILTIRWICSAVVCLRPVGIFHWPWKDLASYAL